MNLTRKLITGFTALTLGVITSVSSVFAATPTVAGSATTPATLSLNKNILTNVGTTAPSGTATFKFTSVTVDGTAATATNMPVISDYTVSFTGAETSVTTLGGTALPAGEIAYTKSNGDILAGVTWPHAGEYIYKVSEQNSGFNLTNNATTSEQMDYSDVVYQIQVIVANNPAGGVFVESISATVVSGSGVVPGTKVTNTNALQGTGFSFDNKFVHTSLGSPAAGSTNKNLEISKTVTGSAGNMAEYFPMTTTVNAPAVVATGTPATYKAYIYEGGAAITPTTDNAIAGPVAPDKSFAVTPGTALTFALKHGQSLVITNAPTGASYDASETDAKGHTGYITQTVNGVAGTEVQALATAATKYVGENANLVALRNNKDSATPTGIITNNLPFVLIGLVAIAGIALVVAKSRMHSTEA